MVEDFRRLFCKVNNILRTNFLAVGALMTQSSIDYGFLFIPNYSNRPGWADLFTPFTPNTGLWINFLSEQRKPANYPLQRTEGTNQIMKDQRLVS